MGATTTEGNNIRMTSYLPHVRVTYHVISIRPQVTAVYMHMLLHYTRYLIPDTTGTLVLLLWCC